MNVQTTGPAGRTLYMLDDNADFCATAKWWLAGAGYEVIDADNGDDAILLAREHRPALALLDIRMEGKTGFDVAAEFPLRVRVLRRADDAD